MPLNRRTQKQVAERLKGNLDYYNRPHPWRTLRGICSALALFGGAAAVAGYYYFKAPEEFMNPGPLSQRHAQLANNCEACHTQGAMIKADSHAAGTILRAEYYAFIDKACADCHKYYAFHVPNTVPDPKRPADKLGAQTENSSCTSCHREHHGPDRMAPVKDSGCAQCHNRQDLMAASAVESLKHKPSDFPQLTKLQGLIYFPKARPTEGYTKAFASFDNNHPAFYYENEKESGGFDTLRYGHYQHDQSKVLFGADGKPRVPLTDKGDRLACAYCHKPDASGQHFQRITFEASCKACHAMPFDPFLPELIIPHGNENRVREFLRGLPTEFENAGRKRGIASGPALQAFVAEAANRVRMRAGGENAFDRIVATLEKQIFFSDYYTPAANNGNTGVGGTAGNSRGRAALSTGPDSAMFAGCKLCHQIALPATSGALPQVAKVIIPDRWLQNGLFNHAKHVDDGKDRLLSCRGCHYSIAQSTLTADINLPKQSRGSGLRRAANNPQPGDPVGCTDCHAHQEGGGVSRCTNCHGYHNDPRKVTTETRPQPPAPRAETSTLRAWLLGSR